MSSSEIVGLWDMQVQDGDTHNPNNPFEWSPEFRTMIGYEDESDFPNILSSWADSLHPDHKDLTLKAFAASIEDQSGMTIYDVEYLLKNKDGSYRWYRAIGDVVRDGDGKATRIVGSLVDINDERQASGDQQFRNNGEY